ncbi:MAG: ATP-binding protein [Peptostreptococcus sp.]|uniref:ATP-binding protein n=1 Tax=Peptostreptococcus sp. TaxID=1262 RepID=UPI002FC64A11
MNKEKMRKIMLEYQYRRDRHQDLLDERVGEIYKKYPNIKSISEEIRKMGLKMTKLVISGASEEDISNISRQQNELINRKNELFIENNIPLDYLELKYECENCKDTGFLENGKRCNCLRQRMLNDSYVMSNLEEILSMDNFENFNLDLFSDKVTEEITVSPRENMKTIFMDTQNYIFNFDKKEGSKKDNLLFSGDPGLGKTFLCSCIAKDLLDKGYTVIYQTAFNLMEVIERYKFKTETFSYLDEENYNNLFTCDLLIIDDLGTEMVNSFTASELFNIINSRLNARKKIIISTNLGLSEIRNSYTDRIVSRIVGNFQMYQFYGSDLRFK